MKDLYTFDSTAEKALQTYKTVREAYSAFFNEFKIPYLTAEADSGDIGGDLSHEYHFPTPKGEDNIISCDSCAYVANEELARSKINNCSDETTAAYCFLYDLPSIVSATVLDDLDKLGDQTRSWFGISDDQLTLYHAIYPKTLEANGAPSRETQFNPRELRLVFPDLNLGVEKPFEAFSGQLTNSTSETNSLKARRIIQIFDGRISQALIDEHNASLSFQKSSPDPQRARSFNRKDLSSDIGRPLDLVRIETGDRCPKCETGSLRVQSAIELGHTFHLGTRYSVPLQANVASEPPAEVCKGKAKTGSIERGSSEVPLQMGCHGIGVSRMIAAVADSLADERGLNWPLVMAPFEVVVIPMSGYEDDGADVLDLLVGAKSRLTEPGMADFYENKVDAVLDDRDKQLGWKLKDADLIGYPIIIVLGNAWRLEKRCEIQCRRLNSLRVSVSVTDLCSYVSRILTRL